MSNAEDSLATLPPLSEKDFLTQVVQLAEIRGWQWLHLRPGMTRDSWRTPISGPLGKGWPDLVLVRGASSKASQGRLIFAELKRDGQQATPEQAAVLEALNEAEGEYLGRACEVYVWHPSDWDEIESVLR